ncbi:MAG: uroporphyrinogen decarboxylase family protein [Planctomycetota bacterium]|jgi:uroporphyrinogen decarboxylase
MDSRERFSLALAHQEPDRVPIDYWASPEINARLLDRFGFKSQEELLQHFDVDFRYIDGPRYIGPEPQVHPDGSVEDHFGTPRIGVQVGSGDKAGEYKEVTKFPLAYAKTVDEILDYPKWPRPDWFDYEVVGEQVSEARQTGKVVVFMGDRMNRCAQLKPAMYLRGFEQIMLDLGGNPEIAECVFQQVSAFYLEYCRRTFEAAGDRIDVFMMGDDFGTQTGLFLSLQMWRKFLRPGFKAFIDLAKQYGYQVAHHSCGSIKPIIPDLIDCGLDILNPIQPDVFDMDFSELKELYGKSLCFHGSISIQKTLPFGTPEDIREEVGRRFETLGPGGGFIFCTAHNIQADTPIENVEALFDAYRTLGRY